MKFARAVLLLSAAAIPVFAAAPAWDSTGNSQLNGTYYFRQVVYDSDAAGNLAGAYAFFGNIAFNGAGAYTISNATFVEDTSQSGYQTSTGNGATGTYSVSSSGFGFLSSPLISGQNVFFLVSKGVLVGSETESTFNSMFVAAPYNSSLGLSSFSGSYTMIGFSTLAPGGGTAATALNYSFQLNPDGAGHLNTVSIAGNTGAGSALNQSSSSVTYTFSNGAYPVKFPTNSTANFYSGQLYLYTSPDSNFVFGGSPVGFDIVVGVKNAANGSSTPLSGLYYEAGLDETETFGLDSYYGVFNAFPQNGIGNVIGHERIYSSGGSNAIGQTYWTDYPTAIANTYQDDSGTVKYTIGNTGIRIVTGIGQQLSIGVALPYSPPAPTGAVYVDPTGVVNTASSAPYTAGIAPGDFITLYNGTNLASSTVFSPPGAFLTSLGGVTVLVDGIAAPIYYVSPTQISFLVPYAASTYPIASIQVRNSSGASNIVTTYVYQTSPGVFTSNPVGGIGVAAMLDFPSKGGYYIVGTNNPAGAGDNVALFLTGLGTPFPPNGDGALGGTTCVSGSCLVNDVAVDIGGFSVATPAFAGLAPGLAGLYQINFQIPPACTTSGQTGCFPQGGNYNLGISGNAAGTSGTLFADSYSNEAFVPITISGGTASARESTAPQDVPAAKAATTRRLNLPRLNKAQTR